MIALCPSRDALKSLSLGEMPDEQSDALFLHLADCQSCQQEMASVEGVEDSLIRNLKNSETEPDPFAEESQVNLAATRALAALGSSNPPTGVAPMPRAIGEYDLLEPLGRGGMGHVYRARHTKLGRDVAIKLIADHRRWDQTTRDRFESEMRTVGGLDHPNLLRAHDAREVDGIAVLVTELIDGMDVGELIRRLGRLSVPQACAIAAEVCKALIYCDAQGLIHRDIKPSNIMVSREGQVKLLDLGLAKLHAEFEGRDFTATGQAIGTADYVAPEQIQGQTVDARSDLYSLGCTLYKALTGAAPFAGQATAFAKMNAHVSEIPPRVRDVRDDVPQLLDKLIASMLEKEPAARPADAAGVEQTLRGLTEGADLAALLSSAEQAGESSSTDAEVVSLHSREARQDVRAPVKPVPSAGRGREWFTRIALALAAMALGIWLGITITVKKKDGTTAKVVIPDGATAIVDSEGNITIELDGEAQAAIDKERVELIEKMETGNVFKSGQPQGGRERPDSNMTSKISYVLPKSDPLFGTLIEGDLADVVVPPPSEFELPQFIATGRIVSIARSSSSQEYVELLLPNPILRTLGPTEVVRHEPERALANESKRLQGVWRVVMLRLNSKQGGMIEAIESAVLVTNNQMVFLNGDREPLNQKHEALARFELDEIGRLLIYHDPKAEPQRGTYFFSKSGLLEIGYGGPGDKNPNHENAEAYLRLSKLEADQSDLSELEQKAFKILASANEIPTSIEFKLLDENEKPISPAILTNSDILEASVVDKDSRPALDLVLTVVAGQRLKYITGRHVGKKLAVFIDGKMQSAPTIQTAIGRNCRIYGEFSLEELQRLEREIVPTLKLDGKRMDQSMSSEKQ